MGTKQFDNVKITSTFTEAETKADLVSGSAIGTLFGQVQKNLKDLDNKERVLTKAEYDTLTEEEKNNDTIYFISDIGGDNLNTDPSSYYTKTEIDTKLTDNYYTKNEIDNKFPKCTYAHSESNGFIKILSLKIRDANLGQDSQTYLRFYDNKLLNDQNNGELFINFRGGGGSGKVPQCQIQVVRADASWNPLSRIKGIYYKQDNQFIFDIFAHFAGVNPNGWITYEFQGINVSPSFPSNLGDNDLIAELPVGTEIIPVFESLNMGNYPVATNTTNGFMTKEFVQKIADLEARIATLETKT